MTFPAPNTGADGGGDGGGGPKVDEAAPKVDEPAAAATDDYKARFLALLSLPAAATDEEIAAKEAEIQATLGSIGDLQTKASSATDLQTQLDEISAKYAELNKQQEAVWKAKQEADADEILKVYEGHFVDDASKAAIRNILLSDKDAGIAILNGLKKPEAGAAAATEGKEADAPPAPKHDPAAGDAATPSDAEIATAVSARVKELQKKFPDKAYNALFAQAEKEVRAKLSTAATA